MWCKTPATRISMSRRKQRSQDDNSSNDDNDLGTRRLYWIRMVVVVGFWSALVIAPKLWLNDEFYGPVSIFGGWPKLIFPLDWLFLLAIGGLLVPVVLSREPAKWIGIWSVVFLARALWDRMIWQPYYYQYFFMLVAIGWSGFGWIQSGRRRQRKVANRQEDPRLALDCCRLILIGIYFWSGISKFNHRFLTSGGQQMLSSLLPTWMFEWVGPHSWVLAALEVVVAIGLLLPRFRSVAAAMAILMHAGILYMLGPTGMSYNEVVWPWNVAMIVLLGLLFWRWPVPTAGQIFGVGRGVRHKMIVVCFLVGPGLSYLGFWPYYVSFKLYSGLSRDAQVFVSDEMKQRLPVDIQESFQPVTQGMFEWRLRLNHWSEDRLGAFAPPERRIHLHVARRFCKYAVGPDDFGLELQGSPNFWNGRARTEQFRCDDL